MAGIVIIDSPPMDISFGCIGCSIGIMSDELKTAAAVAVTSFVMRDRIGMANQW